MLEFPNRDALSQQRPRGSSVNAAKCSAGLPNIVTQSIRIALMEGFGPRLRLLKHRKEIAIVIGPQHRFSQENDRGRVFSEMRKPKHCRILRSQDPQCVGILNFDGMQMIEIAKGLNDCNVLAQKVGGREQHDRGACT